MLVVTTLVTMNALISFSKTPLLPATLVTAAIVTTVTLLCGTVATVGVGRTLHREWRHLNR